MERYLAAAAEYDRICTIAAKAAAGAFDPLDKPTIAWAAETYRVQRLERDDTARLAGRPVSLERIEANQDGFRTMVEDAPPAVIRSSFEDEATALLNSIGLRVDPTSDPFLQLCYALLSVAIETSDDQEARAAGRYVPTPAEPAAPERKPATQDKPQESGDTFRTIALTVMDNPRANVSASTRQSTMTALRYFTEAQGDLPPRKVTPAIVSQWLDMLANYPSRVPHKERSRSFPEIYKRYADRPNVPRLTGKTQSGLLGALSAIWGKAQRLILIDRELTNPFRGHGIKVAPPPETPQELSRTELKAIFALPVFTAGERPSGGKGEAAYWIPLLLLWTGARPEEVAQLLVADVAQDDDRRWTLRYTDEGEHPFKGRRTLKTGQRGRRTITLPAKLVELGFLKYVEKLRAAGELALFPLLRPAGPRRELFRSFGPWWGRYLRQHEVLTAEGGRKPAREFRHNWTTEARRCGIPEDAREYIQGHSVSGKSANDGYGDRRPLGREIDRVKFDWLDLSAVQRWGGERVAA